MRQTTLSRRFNRGDRQNGNRKAFKLAHVSIGKQSQMANSVLSQTQKEKLMKGFRTNQSVIQKSIYNSGANSDIFRSEIVGVNESKSLMKKRVGKFSRIERFRTRQRNNSLNKLDPVIRKTSRSRKDNLKGASSVFDSITKCKGFYINNQSSKRNSEKRASENGGQ
jgi:hypothetical protein